MLLLLAFVLLLFLPGPWNVIGFVVALALFIGEIAYWNSTVKGRRARVGAETLIGARAEVVTPCRPEGQVRIQGELWRARCEAGADPGDTVRVVARSGLTLLVERE